VELHDGSNATWAASTHGRGQQIITHFNAPVSGMVGIGNVEQTQHHALDGEILATLLRDVREEAVLAPGSHGQYISPTST
jgi:hypothetical protein